jgi:hypothetical protein
MSVVFCEAHQVKWNNETVETCPMCKIGRTQQIGDLELEREQRRDRHVPQRHVPKKFYGKRDFQYDNG